MVMDLFRQHERRDPAEVLPSELPEPIKFESHRDYVRKVLNQEVNLTAHGTQFIEGLGANETAATRAYRDQMNSEGSPTEAVAADYIWRPGTEVAFRHATPRQQM
jgi:hypothetical protein